MVKSKATHCDRSICVNGVENRPIRGKNRPSVGMAYEIATVVGIGPVEGIGLFGLFGGTGPVVWVLLLNY